MARSVFFSIFFYRMVTFVWIMFFFPKETRVDWKRLKGGEFLFGKEEEDCSLSQVEELNLEKVEK